MADVVKWIQEDRGENMPPREIPVVKCGCGTLVECDDSWANECRRCGREFNGSGQALAPREFWGEETGETF